MGPLQNNLLLKCQYQLTWVQFETGNMHCSVLDIGTCHMLLFAVFKKEVNIWLICLYLHNITAHALEKKKETAVASLSLIH